MISTELRPIVEAMTGHGPKCSDGEWCDVNVHEPDCPRQGYGRIQQAAIATLANHAQVLVALVETCERLREAYADPACSDWSGTSRAIEEMIVALTAVHSIKETQP